MTPPPVGTESHTTKIGTRAACLACERCKRLLAGSSSDWCAETESCTNRDSASLWNEKTLRCVAYTLASDPHTMSLQHPCHTQHNQAQRAQVSREVRCHPQWSFERRTP